MSPPTNGIQASAAAMLDGSPVDCVLDSPRGGGSGGGFGLAESVPALEEVRSARKDQPWYC